VRKTFDFDWFKVRWQPRYGWIFDRSPAVVVVPVANDGRVWLCRLEREPTGTASWELPGGAIDPGEDAISAGLRELDEECSLVARGGGRVVAAPFELAPGMGRFPHWIVVASNVEPRGRRALGQRDEGIVAVRRFDRARAAKLIRTGQLNVAATLAALVLSGWLDGLAPSFQEPLARRSR
jgi:8-oxo-dGTP pyrophosphatase MutT (NUDIX family)